MQKIIDLRKGHPKARCLPHARLARASRAAALRLDEATEQGFRLNYTIGGAGTPRFFSMLTEFLSSQYRSPCFAEGLFTTNGVSHGLDIACGALCKPGDTVLMEEPSYFLVKQIFDDHHLKVVGVPSDKHGINTEALDARLASGALTPPPKLLYLVPSHGNPRGTSLPLERREHLVQLAQRYGFYILCDDVYHMLDWSAGAAAATAAPPRILELDPAFKARVAKGLDWVPPAPAAAADAAAGAVAAAGGGDDSDDDPVYAAAGGSGAADAAAEAEAEGHVLSIGSFTKILAPGLRLGWIETSARQRAPAHTVTEWMPGEVG